jgi:hypothetical protein
LDSVIADLKAEGVRVTAYINPYLNVKGDIYQQNQNEKIWLTSGLNFTNILRAAFSYESFAQSFFILTF